MAAVNCVYPSLAVPGNGNSTKVLTEEQILKWKEEGYVLVDGVIPGELVNLVREVACKVYPEVKAKESLSVNGADDFGANDRTDMIFPSLGVDKAVVNEIPICKRLITAVSQLLESDEDGLLLAQCELWAKRGVAASRHDEDKTNFDQRIHIDGFNHYLTMPSDWYNPEAVAIIIYYDDCTEVGGATKMVPRTGPKDPAYHSPTVSSFSSPLLLTPGGRGDLPWINNKYNAEKYLEDNHPEIAQFRKDNLYSRECSAVFNEGSVLFYRLDTWHRGTPLIDGKIRRCHNLLYKKSGCTWINQWNTGVARHMYSQQQTVEKLIAGADMQQRTVLGFPAVNSSYWTEYTFAACKERYGALPGGFMYHEEIENELKRRKMNQSSK